ncbi:Dihydrodipicolinate reductase [Caldalkalibacillus thermarum TA2.A1]|uniref:4-hydroxy-tetrahydrodipicolinate reductase n=1 Tax=Caldalkalibacillus thermarum (strain TA2.A1) TaxID=986075 RepID=F5L8W9_CALTT|nr:4-hydroxy-tetrahydrodipicolinate reductase [Caldalkalibacillus thermarum]EGL82251.1 Dihydrodipicolinate reductase [Caldalkalibacillus thermarum TA2.A1]QZT32735.1 4-hydroxy-tetrahydrodipicolinate reductase [Caldalkalibacillus thermarum TA2.A1]
MAIRVIVVGAKGKMGSETVKMIQKDDELQLVCGVDSKLNNVDVGEVIGIGPIGVPFVNDLERALLDFNPDVMVDFTTPQSVKQHVQLAIHHRVRPVIGTTGLTQADIEELQALADQHKIGGIIAPNFAIGAILMMKFAQMAARYMPEVEIIEMHHDQKLDAPSGTAIKTAEMIAEVREEHRQGHPEEKEELQGARGAFYQGFPIHSVRLPGLVAHQQVIFGSEGQTLTIRHDSINRTSFMPGVNMAIKKVVKLECLVYGLDKVMNE